MEKSNMNSNRRRSRALRLVTGFLISCLIAGVSADELANFSAPLKVEYERPGSDFSKFDKLLINDLDLSDAIIVPPPWLAEKAFEWQVSEKNQAHFRQEFLASMKDQISGNDGYPIVDEPGPGVLQLSVKVVSFMPYAEQKDTKAVTLGSGEMTIQAETRDSQTGELLGIYEGPQEVGKEYQKNTDFTKQKNVKMLFDSWGRRVRLALDRDHGE
jgi:hypothetical protein